MGLLTATGYVLLSGQPWLLVGVALSGIVAGLTASPAERALTIAASLAGIGLIITGASSSLLGPPFAAFGVFMLGAAIHHLGRGGPDVAQTPRILP